MYRVIFHPEFVPEWKSLPLHAKQEIGEVLDKLEEAGPHLGRPDVDTLKGSIHANMKELRARCKGQVWRIAFAFDPGQNAIILCGGDKQGINQLQFYKRLLAKADTRFNQWLEAMK